MKKLFGYAVCVAMLVVPAVTMAAVFRTGDQPSVGANEKIANDMYIVGGSISSAGSIDGDLVAGGGNIIISGNVGADILAGGGNVSILSNVGDDVRVGGGNIIIEGKVEGDVIAGGGQITIDGPGVGGDVAIGGGDVRISAPIMGKLSVASGSVFINAPISGDVNIVAEVVKLGSSAVISGNLTYKANHELVKADGAVINGKVTFEPRRGKIIPVAALAGIVSAFLVWKFFALLASAMVAGLLFRRYSEEMVDLAEKRPLFELVRGLIFMVATPAICVLLFVTMVGIPLAAVGVLGYVALLLFAWIMTPILVGSFAYRYFTKKDLEISWKTILLGVFLYTLLGLVPFIGWLAKCLLMLITIGCIVSIKWRILKEWR